MRLPKLDSRLRAIYEMLGDVESVCDVGADHGKLALNLAKAGKSVIATDISDKSLEKTRRVIALHEADVDCRVGDGLKVVSAGEAEAVVIAGMGQGTIIDILSAGKDVVQSAKMIIVQPMNGEYDLRSFLSDEGFDITDEKTVIEAGRIYCIIKAVPQGGRKLTEAEKYFGTHIMGNLKDKVNGKYAQRNIKIFEDILRGMEKAGETNSGRYIDIKKVVDEVKEML